MTRMTRRGRFVRSIAVATALALGGAQPALADPISTSGSIQVLASPPASVLVGAFEDDSNVRLFLERASYVLPSALTVDFTAAGTYDQEADLPSPKPAIPAGTAVNSYYVHSDQVGETGSKYYQGTLTFPASEEILGVALTGGTLASTRAALGLPVPPATTQYPASGTVWELTGNCASGGQDCVTLSADRRTLTLSANTYSAADQLRIVTRGVTTVLIDIKPGGFPNSINLGSNGTVPVAILSSATFDATTVDPASVALAGAAVALRGKGTPMAAVQDVNGDGRLDLVVHVSTEALQLSDTDTQAVLTGQTTTGVAITGTDTVRVVP